ncbi:solute carrier family 22 member 4 [Rhipicephalus sanguineus]|uniref:solute carrier family 22 member 4 n=1 Tax=Rhipicephalus sanguineus TaxID=34632 RepID=UPI001893BB49|nr:solute carrier family 22 member 4 [Rhipicephalus sanguineus]
MPETAAAVATRSVESPGLWETQLPYGEGVFQLLYILSAAIVIGNYLLHSEIFLLTAGVMDHWCRRSDSFANLSVDQWKQLAIPVDENDIIINGEYSHCTIREPPDGGTEARVVRCSSWEYDYTQYGDNIVSAWNLVCDRHWLIEFVRIVYAAASVIPLVAAASFVDSIGRRTALFITIPVVLMSAVASAMPNDLQFFMIVRAIVSASTSALVPPALALVSDVSTMQKFPAHIVAVSLLPFVLMPLTMFAAYLARTGWVAVQLILMIPTCLLLVLYYAVSESPIWLLATGHVKEAERVALRAAKMNNVSAETRF